MRTPKKTQNNKPTETTAPAAGCASFGQSLTTLELSNQFVQNKRATRKFSGENDSLDALAYASAVLVINKDSFDQNKFLSLTRGFVDSADSADTLLRLFADWVNFLIQHKKLTRDAFWIDLPIYRFV